MTLDQGLAFGIVIAHDGAIRLGSLALRPGGGGRLLAAVAAGIVPPDQAFKGFSDDIVIIVGSALVVSAAVARSGVIERVARGSAPISSTSTVRSLRWSVR